MRDCVVVVLEEHRKSEHGRHDAEHQNVLDEVYVQSEVLMEELQRRLCTYNVSCNQFDLCVSHKMFVVVGRIEVGLDSV